MSHNLDSFSQPNMNEVGLNVTGNVYSGSMYSELWRIEIKNGEEDSLVPILNPLLIISHSANSPLSTCRRKLPEWGNMNHEKVYEVSANREKEKTINYWCFEGHINEKLNDQIPWPIRSMGFFGKLYEIHVAMFTINSLLISYHPYQSVPSSWPFSLRGISYYRGTSNYRQIYFLGNPFAWAAGIYCGVLLITIIYSWDLFKEQRGFLRFSVPRLRLRAGCRILLICWMLNYLPYFLMGRVLFLHHYLPAFVFSAFMVGVVFDYTSSNFGEEFLRQFLFLCLLIVLLIGYWFFMATTYALPTTLEDLQLMKWMNSWDFSLKNK